MAKQEKSGTVPAGGIVPVGNGPGPELIIFPDGARTLSHGLPIGARYLGDGNAWVPGVPARDLLPEEWLELPEAVREQCLATKLYELTGAPAPEEA